MRGITQDLSIGLTAKLIGERVPQHLHQNLSSVRSNVFLYL